MKRVVVIGATGNIGVAACRMLAEQGYAVRALAIEGEEDKLEGVVDDVFTGDVRDAASLDGLCRDADIVFSALGKSVSLFAEDDMTFAEIDHHGNGNVLAEAKKQGVGRFVYISIYGSDLYGAYEVARAHRAFEKELEQSGLSYTVIRPVGLFSGLEDLLQMGANGLIITIGEGSCCTNPIHYEDLARIAVEHIEDGPELLDAGGPETLTRWEIGEMAKNVTGCEMHVKIPDLAAAAALPAAAFLGKSFFDKLAFFHKVLTTDVVADALGSRRLAPYFEERAKRYRPA